jgi:hypothetical protein
MIDKVITIGTDRIFRFQVTDYDQHGKEVGPRDLGGHTITCRISFGSAAPAVSKGLGSGVSVPPQTGDDLGVFTVALSAADTASHTRPARVTVEAEITDALGKKISVSAGEYSTRIPR